MDGLGPNPIPNQRVTMHHTCPPGVGILELLFLMIQFVLQVHVKIIPGTVRPSTSNFFPESDHLLELNQAGGHQLNAIRNMMASHASPGAILEQSF